uniref:AlNc14C220G9083 protein n=1 Tax=Albugo laibachii Nc14 TaxID=890382 RepID=F0WRT8_9STRA|nr:AlNc14C220G9083 [Albugo laibachii Nc14]|eukprot:CCA24054.1 AlNc14C220G9083 [Albugo laibachii Nc14]
MTKVLHGINIVFQSMHPERKELANYFCRRQQRSTFQRKLMSTYALLSAHHTRAYVSTTRLRNQRIN